MNVWIHSDSHAYSEYDFEAAVQRLLLRIHDGHVLLLGGLLEVVSFGSPETLISASVDGVQEPRIYLASMSLIKNAE